MTTDSDFAGSIQQNGSPAMRYVNSTQLPLTANYGDAASIPNSTSILASTLSEALAFGNNEDYWPAIDAIDKFVSPVWYIVGIPGNLIAYVVWIQRRMRPSSGCYLAALAMDECIFLFLQLLYELEMRWKVTLLQFPVLCETFPILFLTTQYLSPLLVLGFTVERYISVCHPFQREHYCTTGRARRVIVCLVILSLALHSVQGYFWEFYTATDGVAQHNATENQDHAGSQEAAASAAVERTAGICRVRPEITAGDMSSVWSVWSWVTEMTVFGLVPLAILVLNIFVIRETRLLSRNEFRGPINIHAMTGPAVNLTSAARDSSRHSTSYRSSATTVMLLAVSFYLIATTLPVTLCYLMYPYFPPGDPALAGVADVMWTRHRIYMAVRRIIEEFGMSHYACNLYIYLVTGRIFRRELLHLVGNRCYLERLRSQTAKGTANATAASGGFELLQERESASNRRLTAVGSAACYRRCHDPHTGLGDPKAARSGSPDGDVIAGSLVTISKTTSYASGYVVSDVIVSGSSSY